MSDERYAVEPASREGDPSAGGEPTAYRIEAVTEANLDHYRAVRLAMLLDAPRAFGSTYAGVVAHPRDWWLARITTCPTWLAWEGDRPVGSVGMGRHEGCVPDETSLIGMWVAAPARGRGVAERLVQQVLDAAASEGWRTVTLDVAEENHQARRLYERMGFTPTGRTWRNEVVDGGVDEVELAVRLGHGG